MARSTAVRYHVKCFVAITMLTLCLLFNSINLEYIDNDNIINYIDTLNKINIDSDSEQYVFDEHTIDCFKSNLQTVKEFNNHISRIDNKNELKKVIKYDMNYLELLLNSYTLKLFVTQNSIRESNINTNKCHINIDFVEIHTLFYQCGDGKTYPRDKCQDYNEKCQSYDVLFNLNYLYTQYKDIFKYILILEDDISFCPHLFQFIYNITIIDEYSTISMDLIFLANGFTSYLIKTSYIPIFIKEYINIYQLDEIWKYNRSLDMFTLYYPKYNGIAYMSFNSNMFISDITFTFHPPTKFSESVMNHSYESAFQCYSTNNMRSPRLYAIKSHSMDIFGSKKRIKSKRITENTQYLYGNIKEMNLNQNIMEIRWCYPKHTMMTNNSHLSSFNVYNCSKKIQIYYKYQTINQNKHWYDLVKLNGFGHF